MTPEYCLSPTCSELSQLRARIAELDEKLSWRNRDIEAYRAALCYPVNEGFNGCLSDGSVPVNSRAAELEEERDRYRSALETIADPSTASMTHAGTVDALRSHARIALRG